MLSNLSRCVSSVTVTAAVSLVTAVSLSAYLQEKPAPKPTPVSIAGKWAMTLELEAFTATPALEFKQDGEKITGTYTGRYGAFPLTGTLKERALTFAFKMNAEGMEIQMSYTGEVAADAKTIKGRVSVSELGEGNWSAKREGSL